MPELEPWAPGRPVLHALRLRLLDGERELDRVERRVGFRHLRASGTRVLWNAAPFQMRGVLHWGYSPPHLAPPVDPAWWRPQLEYFRALGFNTLKCCLWVPPRCVYELCDELGLAVWQEYPAWHPNMDQAHREELLREYAEFFALDAGHVSVGFRSITCETGHGADLDVVRALFELCKATVPHSLVVDDSSWIGWQRVTDFWDEHPYGNNQWFVERLEHFRRHIREHGEKPLLLGECMAADTWVDRAAWRTRHGDEARWWRPLCWDAQADAEPWLVREFGEETLASLQPTALAFGMENRRFQIEQLRLGMPDAGYVVSVARDFAKARMGLYDDLDRPKWSAADWAWHGDTMICLAADARDRVADLHHPVARLVVSHYGHGALRGELVVRGGAGDELHRTAVALAPGRNSAPIEVPLPRDPRGFGFSELRAELTGSHPAQNTWRLPSLPDWHLPGVTTRAALDKETLARLLAGERVLLTTGAPDAPGAVRSQALWWLRGAPFAPPHPLYRQVPADVLTHLMAFALESGRVIPWQPWRDEVDPILAFWETHDTDAVRFHLLAFETRVGEGRLLVTSLDLGERAPSYAQALLAFVLARHLESGPPPARALSDATIAALEAHFDARTIELPTWRFRTDPDDVGRERGWSEPATDVTTAAWRDLRAGSHWENQADDLKHYTGVAWYRVDLDVPADWSDVDARLVFDGVDDSFDVWLDGEHLGAFGDPATGTTVWLEQQVQELGRRLRPGSRHALVLRVVDHQGAGGLWRPVRVTTGPVGRMAELLR